MGALSNQSPSGSVLELTDFLRSELSRLSRQDEALEQLIRGFNLLLHELRDGASRQVARDRYPESLMIAARQPQDRGSGNEQTFRPVIRGRTSVSGEKLRRACRIALMESDEAASTEEICSRILRRGSFPFKDLAHARATIARTLEVMARAGEASSINNDGRRRWKDTARADHA